MPCGIFPDQGPNLCFLHWQVDSLPLSQQENSLWWLFKWFRYFSYANILFSFLFFKIKTILLWGKKWTYKRGENNVQSPRCPSSSFSISKLTAKLVSFIFLLTDLSLSTIPISWSKFHPVCPFIHKHVHVCVLSHFSCVQLLATLWTVACQTPLSMGISRQEYWSGLPCSPSRDLPDLGIELVPAGSPALAGGFFTTSPTWEAHINMCVSLKVRIFFFFF